jgi:hypothetical protein
VLFLLLGIGMLVLVDAPRRALGRLAYATRTAKPVQNVLHSAAKLGRSLRNTWSSILGR